MSVSRSRYELLRNRLVLFTRLLHGVEKGRPRAVHRTRVAVRRLREVLPVLQLESDVSRRLGRRLRRVTRRLGVVRELDALLLLVDGMRVSGRYDDPALSRVVGVIARERCDLREQASPKLLAAELCRLGAKLEKIAKGLVGDDPGRAATRGWRWAIDARVSRRAESLQGAVGAAGSVYLADRLHAVRIELKKFRYAVELKGEVAPEQEWGQDLATLKRTQGLLGRLHDRQLLIDRVRQAQASLTPPNPDLWRALDALLTMLEKDCRRLHARYVRDAADLVALCDRLGLRTPDAGRAGAPPRRIEEM